MAQKIPTDFTITHNKYTIIKEVQSTSYFFLFLYGIYMLFLLKYNYICKYGFCSNYIYD